MERDVLPLTWIVQNHIFSVPAPVEREAAVANGWAMRIARLLPPATVTMDQYDC